MKSGGGITACLLLVAALLASLSSSERLANESSNPGNSIITILPGRPYYGVRMNTIHKKHLVDGRYQFECFSAGPDPQGEFKVIPLVSNQGPNSPRSYADAILGKILPNSLLFTRGELYDSKNVVADLKKVSYKKQIQAKDILLNVELEFFEFGLPWLFFQVAGSFLLSILLTALIYKACTKLRLVDRLSRFIFDHKAYKSE